MKNIFCKIFFFLLTNFIFLNVVKSQQPQYLSGHIEYEHQTGNTYEINVILYTYSNFSSPDSVMVYYGDGASNKIELTASTQYNNNIVKNEYVSTHIYIGAGTYQVEFVDTGYNHQSENLDYNLPFRIYSSIRISPFLGSVNSFQFYDYPVKQVKRGDTLVYTPVNVYNNYQPTNESSDYHFEFQHFSSGEIPNGMTINEKTGEVRWAVPAGADEGLYEFYVKAESSPAPNLSFTGSARKHFTVHITDTIPDGLIYNNLDNWNTNNDEYYEYSIYTNQTLNLSFDVDHATADSVHILSESELYSGNNTANFNVTNNGTQSTMNFDWTPDVSRGGDHPYVVHFMPFFKENDYYYYDFITVMIYVEDTTLNTKELLNKDAFKVYPNPASETIYFERETSTQKENHTLRIYTLDGRELIEKHFPTINLLRLNVDLFEQGVYLYEIINPSDLETITKGKFMIKN